MVKLADVWSDPEITNWLKLWLAIDETTTVLRQFVDDEMKSFHTDILQFIKSKLHLPTNAKCTNCLTLNLIKCFTNGICKRDRSGCKTHKTIRHRTCPQNICDKFRDEIIKEHRYSNCSWKNTSAEVWADNRWEVAKCYMPPDGYSGVGTSEDTDFNGIISVIINCKRFDSKLSFSIAPGAANPQRVLTKAREIGKKLRHITKLKITVTDLQDYFQTLTTLLSDPGVLAHDPNARTAVKNLTEIHNDTFNMTMEDLTKMLKHAHQETPLKRQLEEC
ncbi:hypothetical protein DPMN_091500 [Dreissena polymorpha]|uniref:Uncharacterized protein n=1 Tax=Dreissena polymorpha TaxID=45954 RepID=A0A9D4R019_DREPO|nr:hypothetical protein DPMN_091500 [Dreissena polymorpha]